MYVRNKYNINMITAVNNNRLTPVDFQKSIVFIEWDKLSCVVLTNFHHTSPLFEWLGLEQKEVLHNYNSGNKNYVYCGFLKRDRYEAISMMNTVEFTHLCNTTLRIDKHYISPV